MIPVVPELGVEPVMNRGYQLRLLGPVDNSATELDLDVLDRKPLMPHDQRVKSGHVLAVNHRGVVKVAPRKALGLLFEMLPDERDLMRVHGVRHNLLNAAELRLFEDMGGRIEIEGHHLRTRGRDFRPVLLQIR